MRQFILFSIVMTLSLFAVACSHMSDTDAAAAEVVLYSSVDEQLLQEVVRAFEVDTGLKVRIVGDNEANKTTGLVQRLVMEKTGPKADVWWSSEPFGTIGLEREGVLEPYRSEKAEASISGGWPGALRGSSWYGFAQRARVIAYAPGRVDSPPSSVLDLMDPSWNNRIGIARTAFGTMRGHMGTLLEAWGPDGFRAWAEALQANGVRLYDGNASVVRAIRLGEIDVGLTDTDDVWAAKRNGWDIEMVFEPRGVERNGLGSTGTILLPNTIALVRGGPNPENAKKLIDFLLSARVETLMARSESRNIPVHPSVARLFSDLAVGESADIDLEAVASTIPQAMHICDGVFKKP